MPVVTIEKRFAEALVDPDAHVPEGLTSARGMRDGMRFAVYRNNLHVGLVEALAKAFPVTKRLVGEAFFRGLARAFVAQHKPRSPLLMRYGDGFPAFVAGFAPARGLPYLPDLARLEYAWQEAYHAAEAEPLRAALLAGRTDERLFGLSLQPHPATRLICSNHAIGSIWAAHQGDDIRPVETRRPETVLLTRPDAQVRVTLLPALDIPFARGLLAGETIGGAAEAALREARDFDLARALGGLLALGTFSHTPIIDEEFQP
jgi:hypothetical protein